MSIFDEKLARRQTVLEAAEQLCGVGLMLPENLAAATAEVILAALETEIKYTLGNAADAKIARNNAGRMIFELCDRYKITPQR